MSKPDDINQEVWDGVQLMLQETLDQYVPDFITAAVVRAITDAVAAEREEIAQIGDALGDLFDGHALRSFDEMDIIEARGAESAVRKYVAEIRKRGEE